MFARYARRVLLIEFAMYGLASAVMLKLGAGLPFALAAIPACALLMRCAAVAATFVLAAKLAPADPGPPRPAAARVRTVATEVVWTMLAYSVLMPFPRIFARADSRLPADAATLPVLLVHGYLCNGAVWAPMQRFLEAHGVPAYTLDLEPVYAGIDDYVAVLADRIEAICSATGAQRLVIVAHSMGGLAARACLRAGGGARVAKIVTLGTPHQGTRMAAMGLGPNARQMEWGSRWLADLARDERSLPAVPVTSIYGSDDNLVVPRESSVLDGAKSVRVSGVGHVSLAFAAPVRELVLAEVRAA